MKHCLAIAVALLGLSQAFGGPDVPPNTAEFIGPDIIVGDLYEAQLFLDACTTDVCAISIGVVACNAGDTQVLWSDSETGLVLTPELLGNNVPGRGGNVTWTLDGTHYHPLITQNVYRLKDGRFEQLAYSWVKHTMRAEQLERCPELGGCDPGNAFRLGVGCSDSYTAVTNATQHWLGPRCEVQASTGIYPHPFTELQSETSAIGKRLQIPHLVSHANPSSQLLFAEAQLVARDDAYWGNANNNASHRLFEFYRSRLPRFHRPTVLSPAIYAWQQHGLGVDQPDSGVAIESVDVPGDGRFHIGSRAIDEGDGLWRYEYAVHNMNSDRAAGGFVVPIPDGVTVSGIGFKDVDRHSGEELVYDNTDWIITTAPGEVRWSAPENFDLNPNSNALRWGFLYNFWFIADAPPAVVDSTLVLFEPSETHPNSMWVPVHAPASPCACEVDGEHGQVDVFDLLAYLDLWFAGAAAADLDETPGVDVFDLLQFLDCWFAASSEGVCS